MEAHYGNCAMETNRRHRVIIILGLILLPLVAGIISLIIKIALFLAIVAGLYWAYLTFIKKNDVT